MRKLAVTLFVALLMVGSVGLARAQDMSANLAAYEKEWAGVYYGMHKKDQLGRYPDLSDKVAALVKQYPQAAEPLIWQAITLSSFAKAEGGLKALDLAEHARDAALAAAKIDEKALGAGAYTALGVLYYKVPAWPVGFGDDKQAKVYLDKALALAPNAIDVNFFYGDFLLEQGDKEEAKPFLEKALSIAIRPDHQYADSGRKQEVQRDLNKLNK
ncbi:MAG TPA: tetratricopeptide repeat protein [Dongiaceae bacterium]|jgi:tetratricopeptide (TPR) repeat protein